MIPTDLVLKAVLDLQPRWRSLLGDEGALQAQSLLHLAAEDVTQRDCIAERLVDHFETCGARDVLMDEMPLGLKKGGKHPTFEDLIGNPGPVAALGVRYRCPELGCPATWTPQMAGERIPHCPEHNQLLEKSETKASSQT